MKKESNFDRLLFMYVTGKLSEAENEKMDAWLDVAGTRYGSNPKFTNTDEERLYQLIFDPDCSVSDIEQFQPETPPKRLNFLKRIWRSFA